jgi:hypothetical protein
MTITRVVVGLLASSFGSACGLKVTDNTTVMETAVYIGTDIFIDKTILPIESRIEAIQVCGILLVLVTGSFIALAWVSTRIWAWHFALACHQDARVGFLPLQRVRAGSSQHICATRKRLKEHI